MHNLNKNIKFEMTLGTKWFVEKTPLHQESENKIFLADPIFLLVISWTTTVSLTVKKFDLILKSINTNDVQYWHEPSYWVKKRQKSIVEFPAALLCPVATATQFVQMTLNKIENTFNGTFVGWKSMHQGLRIYFFWNPRLKAIETAS